MKRKHMVLIYTLLIIVAVFSGCSKKEENSNPIIIDHIQNNSEAENDSLNSEVTPREEPHTEEPTPSEVQDYNVMEEDNGTIEGEDNSAIEASTQPEKNNSTENSSDAEVTSDNGLLDTDIDGSSNNVLEDNVTQSNKLDSNDIENYETPNSDVTEDVTKNSDPDDIATAKKIIAVDAGHQSKGNYSEEPIGPGSTTTKPKVSSGTQGKFTGVTEYELNLLIAKKVEAELIDRGYEVFMIRETHDVNLSNRERAEMANQSGADLFIRIHADGSTNPDVNGASTLYPSKDNMYVSNLSKASHTLSDFIIDSICESTGAKNRGAIARDDMSGINWCTLPVTIIEMGYMSNKKEDKLMQTNEYQNNIVNGICDGIDKYYE